MNAPAKKKELINWIDQLDNPDMLEAIDSLKNSSQSVAWDDLPEETKVGIIKGHRDIKEGRIHTSEEFWDRIHKRVSS